jgi:hypothetical protein
MEAPLARAEAEVVEEEEETCGGRIIVKDRRGGGYCKRHLRKNLQLTTRT